MSPVQLLCLRLCVYSSVILCSVCAPVCVFVHNQIRIPFPSHIRGRPGHGNNRLQRLPNHAKVRPDSVFETASKRKGPGLREIWQIRHCFGWKFWQRAFSLSAAGDEKRTAKNVTRRKTGKQLQPGARLLGYIAHRIH